jgi:lipopolysaccharide transport system permease protein
MSDYSEEVIIEAGTTEKNYWKDIWRFRELFYILSWRDIKVRYKQTVIGTAWSVIRPVLTTIIFTVIFGRVAKMDTPGNIPYPLMVFAGILPWQFFSNALSEASSSLVSNTNLISKVYFPRLIVPASSVITSLVDDDLLPAHAASAGFVSSVSHHYGISFCIRPGSADHCHECQIP